MRRIFWIAACLLMLGEIQIANAQVTEMLTGFFHLCNNLLGTYNEAVKRGDVELAQKKRDALVSIDTALIHMSTIKKQMGANIRRLGENQARPDDDARSEFDLCFDNLNTENNDLEAQVGNLKSSIDLADPHWISRHPEDARQIDNLYYEKLGIHGRVLQFIHRSRHGIIIHNVSVEPNECKQLAGSLDAEAHRLINLEAPIGKALRS